MYWRCCLVSALVFVFAVLGWAGPPCLCFAIVLIPVGPPVASDITDWEWAAACMGLAG